MKHNIGKADRGLRAVVGMLIIVMGYTYQSYWGVLGLVLLATSATSFCPLYALVGFSSCPTHRNEEEKDVIA